MFFLRVICVLFFTINFSACKSNSSTNQSISSAANEVEIYLTSLLDGKTTNYCIDIAGGNKNIDIKKGLQAHTCYSYKGSLGVDQIFDLNSFAKNLLYMPKFDVCVTLDSLTIGSKVGLTKCDGSELQKFTFSGKGKISSKVKPQLCLTVEKETRFGRSKVHQIKKLSLQNCSDQLSDHQSWSHRK